MFARDIIFHWNIFILNKIISVLHKFIAEEQWPKEKGNSTEWINGHWKVDKPVWRGFRKREKSKCCYGIGDNIKLKNTVTKLIMPSLVVECLYLLISYISWIWTFSFHSFRRLSCFNDNTSQAYFFPRTWSKFSGIMLDILISLINFHLFGTILFTLQLLLLYIFII